MTKSDVCRGVGAALIAALFVMLLEIPAASAPVPAVPPAIRLTSSGEVKVPDQTVTAATMIDDNTVAVVGSQEGENALPTSLPPNGAIIDLVTKHVRRFTNGHTACINGIVTTRGRVTTASTNKDPVLRIWDVKAGKTVGAFEIDKPADKSVDYSVAGFHRDDRVAVGADERILVVNLNRPTDRATLEHPLLAKDSPKLVDVSPDDAHVACATVGCRLLIWEVATRKATAVVSLVPDRDDPRDWLLYATSFGPRGDLFVCRHGKGDEVPEKVSEKDVPPERRGVARIDIRTGRVEPMGMGHTICTLCCAVDRTGTWLVTGGTSRPDQPQPDGDIVVGELRVYHLPTRTLAYREQLEGLPPKWLAFTPNGRRLVSASLDAAVKWWDVVAR